MTTILRHVDTIREIMRLPQARLHFDARIESDEVSETYRDFTRPHPRYRIIGHKTVGAALIDLERFDGVSAYLAAIQARNHGGWHAKRARSRGYVCTTIERNDHIDEIHAINTSLDQRQGRPMDANYLHKVSSYERLPHYDYYGVLNDDGRLVAYGNIACYGNFSAFSQLMGLRNNDGIMHLLVVEIVTRLLEKRRVRYVMYDTFFGAKPGLQQFKRILGFEPYHVKYSMQ